MYPGGPRTKEKIKEIINNTGDLFHIIVTYKDMSGESHFFWKISVCYINTFEFITVDTDFY